MNLIPNMAFLVNTIMDNKKLNQALTQGFSGSYKPEQVTFLLKRLELKPTDTEEKERLIQTGKKHYSEMISAESAPTLKHLELYKQAMAQGQVRYANEVQEIAKNISEQWQLSKESPIVLISFVRAGAPLGILLNDALRDLGHASVHYGLSIIRDKGIDHAALELLIQKYGVESLYFIDGWTGKGAISQELNRSVGQDPRFIAVMKKYNRDMLPLVVLSDLGGCAWLAASGDDWLIPSGVLGSTISGLISRSICQGDALQPDQINEDNLNDWHGCLEYPHLAEFDLSQQFIDHINEVRRTSCMQESATWTSQQRKTQREQTQLVIKNVAEEYEINNLNRIKAGIAEATRAILRRVPELVLLQHADDEDTALLRHLTKETNTPILVVGESIAPYRAITLIQKMEK